MIKSIKQKTVDIIRLCQLLKNIAGKKLKHILNK